MKKLFIVGLLGIAVAAVYFGVVTFKSDDKGLSIGYDKGRAVEVVDKVKAGADKALQKGQQIVD